MDEHFFLRAPAIVDRRCRHVFCAKAEIALVS
jgi:hypothetical protein